MKKFLKNAIKGTAKFLYNVACIAGGGTAAVTGVTTGNIPAALAGASLIGSTISSCFKDKDIKQETTTFAKTTALLMNLANILGRNDGYAKNDKNCNAQINLARKF